MKHISSKNICLLIRDALKLNDRQVMDHGSCVGYIVYKMLEAKEMFEEFEMAELSFITSIHNIGAYQTDDTKKLLQPGYKNVMPHSVYGYLFMKHLFPVPEYAKILLYHHMDYNRMGNVEYEFKFISGYIHFADDICMHLAENPDYDYLQMSDDIGTKYSEDSFEYFARAEEKYNVLEKLKTGEYKQELDKLLDYVMFRNDEKKKYVEMLMYCGGFRHKYAVVDAVTCVCISEEIGKKIMLDADEQDTLFYGSLMHDIGMLAMPRAIIDAPRQLTEEEKQQLREHVEKAETLLRKRFTDQNIVDVAVRHHERLDGSGYPKGLKASQMTRVDKILQISDVVCAMTNRRSYHEIRNKEQVVSILREEADNKKLDEGIIKIFLDNYDDIMERVRRESKAILVTYEKIRTQYNAAITKL